MKLRISHTALSAYRTNPRKFFYDYAAACRQESVSEYLVFGQALHRMEQLRTEGVVEAEIIATICTEFPAMPVEGPRGRAHLFALWPLYQAAYPTIEADTELEIAFPLSEEIDYIGHIDLLPKSGDHLIDIKTTSRHLFYDWAPTIGPSAQAIGYILAAQSIGRKEVTSCLFRGVSTDHKLMDPTYVPKRKTGGFGERPPLFLDITYTPQPHEIEEWLTNTRKDCVRLLEDLKSGNFSCTCSIGTVCEKRNWCLTPPAERAIFIERAEKKPFRGFSFEE
jgi:hypothetical protein